MRGETAPLRGETAPLLTEAASEDAKEAQAYEITKRVEITQMGDVLGEAVLGGEGSAGAKGAMVRNWFSVRRPFPRALTQLYVTQQAPCSGIWYALLCAPRCSEVLTGALAIRCSCANPMFLCYA